MKNACELVMLIDRSGSMVKCQIEAENAINEFIKTQAQDGTLTYFTLVEFDNEVNTPIKAVTLDKDSTPSYNLTPRGMTRLYDAIGIAIKATGDRLSAMPENERPDKVVFVIMTDGEENNSKEFKSDQIKNMISVQENVYNWKFIYLGANQDAFAVANTIGTRSTRSSDYDVRDFYSTCVVTSDVVSRYKSSPSGSGCDLEFTDEDRLNIKGALK